MNVSGKLAEEWHKPVIKKIKKRKVNARFNDNIWAKTLAEMEAFSSQDKNIKYSLCVIVAITEQAAVKPLKNKNKLKQLN